MWAIYLIGGLATIGVLLVAIPIMIIRGIGAFAELLRGAEVEDDDP